MPIFVNGSSRCGPNCNSISHRQEESFCTSKNTLRKNECGHLLLLSLVFLFPFFKILKIIEELSVDFASPNM